MTVAKPYLTRSSHAFAVHWEVLALTLRHRELRRAWLGATAPVAVLTLALGLAAVGSPATRGLFLKEREKPGKALVVDATEAADAADDEIEPSPTPSPSPSGPPAPDAPDAGAAIGASGAVLPPEIAAALPKGIAERLPPEAVAAIAEAAAEEKREAASRPAGPAKAARARAHAALEKLAHERRGTGGAAPDGVVLDGTQAREALAAVAGSVAAEAEAAAHGKGERERRWSWPAILSAFYAALVFVESVLLGLFRDHQEQLSRRLCLAAGAEPEDPEAKPRIRVNWPWLKRKLERRLRGFLVIGAGAVPIGLLSAVPALGKPLAQVATAAWGVYWLAVFSLGSARIAWTHEREGQPFFIRACERATKVPVAGRVVRLFTRIWTYLARTVRPGCLTLEEKPWEGLGLGLARALLGLPVINGLARPLLPVTAQLLLRDSTSTVPTAPAVDDIDPQGRIGP
jgi:hypothetical protein